MKMSADVATRAAYEARLRMQNDIIAGQSIKFNQGVELGRKQGEEIGEARGRRDNALETARKLLSMDLSVDLIVRATGLSPSVVEGLMK